MEFRSRLAAALDENMCARMTPVDLSNVVWAVAVLRMGEFGNLSSRLGHAATNVNWGKLRGTQVPKLGWGLARMLPGTRVGADDWVSRLLAAGEIAPITSNQSFGDLVWAMAELGYGPDKLRNVLCRYPRNHIGTHAYGVLLRVAGRDSDFYVEVLRHLARNCKSRGLRAAVLNAVVLRCLAANKIESAREVLREMAESELYSPVTYRIISRMSGSFGSNGLGFEGKPAMPGLADPGAGSHKYVNALYHVFQHTKPGRPVAALRALEGFSSKKGWLKFGAADEKGTVVEDNVRKLRSRGVPKRILEFGTFLGYSAVRMALVLGEGARIVTLESDPEVACLAMNFVEYSGVRADIDIRIGQCSDLVPQLASELGEGSVGLVYMDHNQMTYHQDLAQLEENDLLAHGASVIATQVLKPGAPLLVWRLKQAEQAGRLCDPLEIVSSPDCGCPRMEDWVAIASLKSTSRGERWVPSEPPEELRVLAAECNLMRLRTAQGLVDEQRWNAFVQHVRRSTERITGAFSSRGVWPNESVRTEARNLHYNRTDFF